MCIIKKKLRLYWLNQYKTTQNLNSPCTEYMQYLTKWGLCNINEKGKKLADRASNLLVHFSRLECYEREAPFWKYSNPSPKQRRLDEDNTEGTEAFHPDLHPSHQKVHSTPLAVTGKKPSPGATPALHPAPSSSVPTSLRQLGGPPFLWKKVYSYQVHPHPSSIHPIPPSFKVPFKIPTRLHLGDFHSQRRSRGPRLWSGCWGRHVAWSLRKVSLIHITAHLIHISPF